MSQIYFNHRHHCITFVYLLCVHYWRTQYLSGDKRQYIIIQKHLLKYLILKRGEIMKSPNTQNYFSFTLQKSCDLQMFQDVSEGREVKNTPACIDYMLYCTFNVKLSSQNPPTWFWLWGQTSVRAGALEDKHRMKHGSLLDI